eukprot:6736878-Pyramimonas_sp.AAC.1
MRAVWSVLEVTTWAPSGLYTTPVTWSLWPWRRTIGRVRPPSGGRGDRERKSGGRFASCGVAKRQACPFCRGMAAVPVLSWSAGFENANQRHPSRSFHLLATSHTKRTLRG